MIKGPSPAFAIILAFCDLLCIGAAGMISSWMAWICGAPDAMMGRLFFTILAGVFWMLPHTQPQRRWPGGLARQTGSLAIAIFKIIAGATFFTLITGSPSPGAVFIQAFALSCFSLVGLVRVIENTTIINLAPAGYGGRRALFIGANDRALGLLDALRAMDPFVCGIVGVLDDDPARAVALEKRDVPYLGPLDDLEHILLTHVVDEVYVCLPVRTYFEKITSMACLCEGIGAPLRLIADLFPLRIATSRVRQLGGIPLLSLSAVPEAQEQLLLKRLADITISGLFLLLAAWWLFPLIALTIRLDSSGPAFFIQERIGRNQRRFRMYKFRSMTIDADEMKSSLLMRNEADGPVFKMRDDPRVTRLGRWLRRYSIDELPQFINILKGDMSLVGPRPPLPGEVERYTWEQRRRLSIRPGLTGLQQVSGRSGLSFEEWINLDLSYIDTWSLFGDVRILARTLTAVLTARGAS